MVNKKDDEPSNLYGKILWVHVPGVVIVAALLFAVFPYSLPPSGNFVYVYDYHAVYNYTEDVVFNKKMVPPSTYLVPKLYVTFRNYTLEDVLNLTRAFKMQSPHIDDYGYYFLVKSNQASLLVYKDGYVVKYIRKDVFKAPFNISADKAVAISNEYLKNLSEFCPGGVFVSGYKISEGRYYFDGGNRVFYTRNVSYNLSFGNYPLFMDLTVELDSRGDLVGFYSNSVIVNYGEKYVQIGDFEDAYHYMEKKGVPIPYEPWNVSKIVVNNVTLGFKLLRGNRACLMPGYQIYFEVYLTNGSVKVQSLFEGWEGYHG